MIVNRQTIDHVSVKKIKMACTLNAPEEKLKKYMLVVCVLMVFSLFLSGMSFSVLSKLDRLAKASHAHYNLWQKIPRQLDYALGRSSANVLSAELTERAKLRITELMKIESELQQKVEALTHFNILMRLMVGASKEDMRYIQTASVAPNIYANISQSQQAPLELFQLGFSQWDVPSLVSLRSGAAFRPLEDRAQLLESFLLRGYAMGPWVIIVLSCVVLSLIWLIWRRGLSPVLGNLQCALQENEFQRDSAQHKNAELIAAEIRLRNTLDNLPVMVANLDMDFRFESVNSLYLTEFGIRDEAFLKGKPVSDLFGQKEFEKIKARISRCYAGESFDFDHIVQLSSGRKRVHVYYEPLRDEFGNINRVLCLIVDVDKHYQTEMSLRQSEEYIRIALNSIGDAVIATDEKGVIQQINSVAENLTGWSESTALAQSIENVVEIVDADTQGALENPVHHVLRTAEESTLVNQLSLISKQGHQFLITHTATPIFNVRNEVRGCVLTFRDISKEFARRLQLIQLEKMRAVGILSGGISHDFNNLLAGISSSAELLQLKTEAKLSQTELGLLENIVNITGRGADLASKLTTFSQSREYVFRLLDVEKLFNNVLDIFKRTTRKDIAISMQKIASETLVLGDESSLHSAFFNVLINAGLAMPGGGNISIQLQRRYLDEEACDGLAFALQPGNYVEIVISDTGVGMSDDVMERIFEPFFTTRVQGEGSGLGLSTAYGTVVEHDGAILVNSAPQKGTVFTIFLPTASADSTQEIGQFTQQEASVSRTVLLIDDEKNLADTLSVFVETLGHNVLVAYDGQMGLETFAGQADNIDLVIIDMNMPILDGAQAIQSMRALSDNCKFIGISGHSSENFQVADSQPGADAVLLKPFRLNALQECMDTVLGQI